MTKREFTAIILKLMGIYILVSYLSQFVASLMIPLNMLWQNQNNSNGSMEIIAFLLIPAFLYFLGSVLLIVKSDWVSRRLIKNDGEFNVGFSLTKVDLLTICFCCIGLVLMVTVIPELVQDIAQISLTSTDLKGVMGSHSLIRRYSMLAAHLTQVVIGFGLFLQAPGLANLWHKLRNYKGPVNKLPEN